MAALQIPRPSIERPKSGTLDETDRYSQKIKDWRQSMNEEAVRSQRNNDEYDYIDQYINYISGMQWNDSRPRYRSRFRDNRIAKTRIEYLAYLTDIRPTIDIYSKFHNYDRQAEIAMNVIQYEWSRLNLDLVLAELIDHALFGVAYWKMGAYLPGAFSVLACGMDTVLPIQEGRNLQDSTAILYRTFKPPHYFHAAYPYTSDNIEKEAAPTPLGDQSNMYARPWNVSEYTWKLMSPAMKYHMAKRGPKATVTDYQNNFPVIELQEYWTEDFHTNEFGTDVQIKDPFKELDEHNYHYIVKPGQRLFPRKRLVIFGGEKLLYDGTSPYWHGQFPFAKLCLNPIVWGPNGLSIYRDLIPLQRGINEIGAGILDNIKRAVNQQIIAKDGSVKRASWERFFPDMPGGKLEMTPISNPATDVRYIDPPQLPSYVMQFHGQLISDFRESSGMLDVGGMGKKKQIPGGDTITAMKDSLQTPFRLESRYIEAFLKQAGEQAVSNVFQFFNTRQRMRMLGPNGLTPQDFDFEPAEMKPFDVPREDLAYMFPLQIAQGSLHGASKDRDRQMAIILQRQHAISLKELYRRLDVANGDLILKELHDEAQMGIGIPPKGRQHQTDGQKKGRPV